MTEYVLCYAAEFNDLYVVRKQKPEWQKGMYNLPGGRIEDGEDHVLAARRELKEEVGVDKFSNSNIKLMGKIIGVDYLVYVVSVMTSLPQPTSPTNEEVVIKSIRDILNHKKTINNLRLIIPLCCSNVKGWILDYTKGEDPVIRFEN